MTRSGLVAVFVDTSLDTHLAIAVSPDDTVASVKRKFASEHGLCFPEVGQINIAALMTRWQGKEYHLSETLSISVVLQMEGGCFLKALVATNTDKQPVVLFAGPNEVVNTSLKKKTKRKRNIASFEDTTTTLRPTQSRKVGEEEFQVKGHGENRPSNDSYCDAKDGESRKSEAEYIKEAPLCSEKAKDISGKNSRHDSESQEIPGPAKKKAKNDDAKKKVVRKDGDIIKKDGSFLEVTQTIGTVVLTEKKTKQRDRTKTKGPCSDLPSEVKHKPQIEDRNQVRPDTDTDNQPVVCFAGPTEVVNTSLKKKKKKCKRNASFEDPTTLRLTPRQSRTEAEEELQGHGENQPSNDSYCDANKGESRKAETNDASIAVCEQEYIKEAPLPLCLEKEKGISGNNSRHDSESPVIIKHKPQVEEYRNQVSLSHKEKAEKPGEKDIWSGSHEGGNTKKKREGDEKDIMSSCHENKTEAAITEMAAEVQLEAVSSTYSNNVLLCKELLPPCKKNLLVLDINGILVDITSDYKYQQYANFKISGKLGFKRPFCVDFLKFCFANFEVGVWSSRKQHNLEEAVHHLFGEMKNKLLFCWDQSKCTDTKFKTMEKKPLFFKELNKLWEKVEADLPWEKGRFTPSNTLLVDDSPCKALRNPPYTAIFPYPYTFYNKEDNSLGRGGEMRIYLEKIAAVENIPEFVKENPFGQSAITPHQRPQWNYYYGILEALKRLAPAF